MNVCTRVIMYGCVASDTATIAAPAASGAPRKRSGAPERNRMTKPVRSSSPAELRFGCLRISPATTASISSGGSMPRQNPSSATGRRLSHHARQTTAARRPKSVGWTDMNPSLSQRVAPFTVTLISCDRSTMHGWR